MEFSKLDRAARQEMLASLQTEYDGWKAKKLSLDLSRGKPGAAQLDLLQGMLDCIDSSYDCRTADGFDCRNYGVLDGIKEAKLPVMVIFEGWGAAGKGSVIDRVMGDD